MLAGEATATLRTQSSYDAFSNDEIEMLRDTWPLELLQDPAKQPRVVASAHEFLREVLLGDHLGDFVLLRNGVELLDLKEEDCLPADILELFEGSENDTVVNWLNRIAQKETLLQRYKASIQYIDERGRQRSILPKERSNFGKRVEEMRRMVSNGRLDPKLLYVAEMRLQKQELHPFGGEKTKTICRKDLKDAIGAYAAWTLYWDRHDEGVFVGGAGSGKGVHVDQVLWSNVGKNWRGYKLAAAWPNGNCSSEVTRVFDGQLFSPPLSEVQKQALQRAAKVVLIRPGDLFVFSGGTAHTVLCISEGLSVTAYESVVSLHPAHVEHFLQTGKPEGPHGFASRMNKADVDDVKDDVIIQLEDVVDQLEDGGPEKKPLDEKASLQWLETLRQLNADEDLRQKLLMYFVEAIDLCKKDKYMREHLEARVCSLAEALLSEAEMNKRRRLAYPTCVSL